MRDAAVSLLTNFKAFLYENPLVTEAVNTLPKYRIAEINKEAENRQKNQSQKVVELMSRPVSAKDEFGQRIQKNDLIGHLRILSTIPLSQVQSSVLS